MEVQSFTGAKEFVESEEITEEIIQLAQKMSFKGNSIVPKNNVINVFTFN